MPQEIVLKKAEIYVNIKLSGYEAALIRKLREFEFGEFRVIKQRGEPRRCESIGSEILKESEGLALEIEENQKQLNSNDKNITIDK